MSNNSSSCNMPYDTCMARMSRFCVLCPEEIGTFSQPSPVHHGSITHPVRQIMCFVKVFCAHSFWRRKRLQDVVHALIRHPVGMRAHAMLLEDVMHPPPGTCPRKLVLIFAATWTVEADFELSCWPIFGKTNDGEWEWKPTLVLFLREVNRTKSFLESIGCWTRPLETSGYQPQLTHCGTHPKEDLVRSWW